MTTSPLPPSPTAPAAAARLAGRLVLGQDGHESGAAVPKVATGIGGFDHVTMGGLTERRTTVVAGPAGAAKTLFAAQFLAEGVRRGEPAVFVTLEEPAVDLRANFATLGWDVAAWEAAGDWRFVDGSPLVLVPGERPRFDVEVLAAQIGAAVDRTGARRLALDSLTAVMALQPDPGLARQLLRTLVLRLRSMALTVVVTVETDDGASGVLSDYGVEEFVADNVVLLRHLREGTFRRRTVEVLKMRGAMHHKGDVPFTIVPGEGVRVLPVNDRSDVVDLTRPAPHRVPTGVAGWDEASGGGLLSGSSTVLFGATGTGKTMLVTQFAVEGAARGERVLLLAYEESHEQVLRNGAALGHDAVALEREGLLHVAAYYPEVASLDDHLVQLRELVENLRPTRIGLDGLSALERLGSPRSYTNFLLGVTGLVRDHRLTSVVTVSRAAASSGTTPFEHHDITGLAETIVVLRHHEDGTAVRRSLVIQRMRGSSHDNTVRELVIDADGITLAGPLTAPPDLPLTP